MKAKIFYAALALVLFAGCSDNDYVGDKSLLENNGGGGAISFTSGMPSITRAAGDKTGAAAAADLNNQFIVWGEKNEASGDAATSGNLVFKNYLVDWVDNSAYTTTSNTKGWEYVGLKLDDGTASPATTTYSTNISSNSGTEAQTIKYWDYGASTYTFTAVSALPADITAGNVKITKTESGSTVYDKGYSVALTADANLDKLFFAERQSIAKTANTDHTQTNKYGGNVTFRFHNVTTKVRVAMYETVPGYSVTIKEFKVADAANPEFSAMTTSKTGNFAANLQNNASGTAGTMTVSYVAEAGSTQNYPKVSFDGTKANVLELGANLKADVTIGESATGATYDKNEKAYTSVFPNESNAQNLKLKLSYTLTAPGTGETIEVTDKTAEIPANYLKWKPGFAYTYIFKITDDALYPITFDAIEVVDGDGVAEYITTVSNPSITTFGVKESKYVTGKDEYVAGSDIYATIMDGSSVADFTFNSQAAGGVNVYLATTTDATNFPITEASVAESLAELSTGTKKITCTPKNTDGTTSFTAAPVKVTTVPAEDGTTKTINALKLTGAAATTETTALVVEYIKTPATYHTSSSTYTMADESAFNTEISTNGKLYTDAATTTELTWSAYNTDASSRAATYFRRTSVNTVGVYAYKVIRVVAAP